MLALLVAAMAGLSCPVDTAEYVLRGDPGVTASFRPVDSGPDWPSGLALWIRIARTGQDSWWLPWNGGTDDKQNLASTSDVMAPGWRPPSPDGGPRPAGDIEYIGMNRDYDVADAVPRRGERAPAHFLLPHLGEALWYHGKPPHADRPGKRFFDLVACTPVRRAS